MLGNIYQTPPSSRPKYALEARNLASEAGSPIRKGLMLALMFLAAGLFAFLPDRDGEVVEVEAADAAAALAANTDVAAAPEATTPGYLQEVAGDTASADVADSSTGDIGRMALANSAALSGLADEARLAAATATTVAPTTTAAPATVAPTTAPPATAAPTTTPVEPAAAGAAAGEDSEESTTTSAVDQVDDSSTTVADGSDAGSEEVTTTTAAAADAPAEESTTTAPPTTVAETTVPPTTAAPAEPGWVDAGHGVLVPQVLLDIRHCESRGNYTAANPSSSARGAYQFLTGSWAAYGHKERYGVNQAHLASPAQQDEAALITWKRDGTRPWNASRHCWG